MTSNAMRTCKQCDIEKHIGEFTKGKAVCKGCRNETKKTNYNTKLCIHCEKCKPKNEFRYSERYVCKQCTTEIYERFKVEPNTFNRTGLQDGNRIFWLTDDQYTIFYDLTPRDKDLCSPEPMTALSNFYKYLNSISPK